MGNSITLAYPDEAVGHFVDSDPCERPRPPGGLGYSFKQPCYDRSMYVIGISNNYIARSWSPADFPWLATKPKKSPRMYWPVVMGCWVEGEANGKRAMASTILLLCVCGTTCGLIGLDPAAFVLMYCYIGTIFVLYTHLDRFLHAGWPIFRLAPDAKYLEFCPGRPPGITGWP